VLTLVAMVAGRAAAAVLLEADQLTGAPVLARVREADVALGHDLRVAAVCQRTAIISRVLCDGFCASCISRFLLPESLSTIAIIAVLDDGVNIVKIFFLRRHAHWGLEAWGVWRSEASGSLNCLYNPGSKGE